MPTIQVEYTLNVPAACLTEFHFSPGALRRLTPPPVFVQIHHAESLAEGSRLDFTLWFGPLPIRWQAVHLQVDPGSGFTDQQIAGPMAQWVHRHAWRDLPQGGTLMTETIEYAHQPGVQGLLTHLLFAHPLLEFLLAYRRRVLSHVCGL